MLTITPVVLPYNRRKDGSYNVKIRVTWKGKSRYIATNLWCGKDDLTRSFKIKSPAVVAGETARPQPEGRADHRTGEPCAPKVVRA